MGGGRLVLLGVPPGNPGGASGRFRSELAGADIVVAEDPQRLARLARDLGVTVAGRVVSYGNSDERAGTPPVVAAARDGGCVALVTDGRPGADPVHRLVVAAHESGVPVTVVPGPSPVTAALAASGLPADRFCVEGYPPPGATARRAWLAELAREARTLVFTAAAAEVAGILADLAAAFGPDRPAALCPEPAGRYERVRRAGLGALAEDVAADPPPGEAALVVAGAPAPAAPDPETLRAAVTAHRAAGVSHRDAVAVVAREYGVRRSDLYRLTVD